MTHLQHGGRQDIVAPLLQVVDRQHVRMAVWERGAGATLACGTGACATVVAGVLEGRTDRNCRCGRCLLEQCIIICILAVSRKKQSSVRQARLMPDGKFASVTLLSCM